jgi:hypothetical protein
MKFSIKGKVGKERYYIDGREVTRRAYERAMEAEKPALFREGYATGGQQPSCWPMTHTRGLACHKSQVKAMNERNAKRGCSVTYAPDGKPIIPDRGEYRRVLEIEGMHNNDGNGSRD